MDVVKSQPTKDAEVEALVQSLYDRLVENGGWNKLLKQLRTSLEHSAWEEKLNDYAKEQAVKHNGEIHLNELLGLVTPHAKATIPSQLQEQLLNNLRTYVGDNVEE